MKGLRASDDWMHPHRRAFLIEHTSLKILQIHPFLKGEGLNPRAGGKSRLSLQLSRELAARGNEVAIFPFPEPILEKPYWIDNPGKPMRLLPTARTPAR